MIAKAWRLARKDLTLFVRDRGAVLASLGIPIALVTVFGGAMGAMGGGDGVGRIELALQDDDHSSASSALIAQLERSKNLELLPNPDARERVANGREPIGLVVSAGYGERLAAGEGSGLIVLRDPSKQIEAQIAAAALVPAIFEVGGRNLGRDIARRSLDLFEVPVQLRPMIAGLMEQSFAAFEALDWKQPEAEPAVPEGAGSHPDEFDLVADVGELLGVAVEDVAGDAGVSQRVAMQAHSVSGMAVMMLLFGLVGAGGTLIEERTEGTLDRLRLAPGSSTAILLGKFISALLIGLGQLVILFLYGALVFDTPVLRAPGSLLLVSLCVALAATSFGILFATICRSRKQLEGLSTLVILTMSALGGSWFPLLITPQWFQTMAHFTLNAWAMDAYQGLFWYGRTGLELWPELAVLLCISAAMSAFALHLWKRSLKRA